MAKSFLTAVTETLKRVNIVQGTDPLDSLTKSSIQTDIDTAKQIWNELIDDLYGKSDTPLPQVAKEATITLQTGTREYSLPTDLEQITWPLINEVNGYTIDPYYGGYEKLRRDQLQPSKWEGRPLYAVVSPITGLLRMDRIPTASENGVEYKLLYVRRIEMANASDTFPFSDDVVDALVPAVAELWRRQRNQDFDAPIFRRSYARALETLSKNKRRMTW